jgi:hypothetical protein
VSGVAELRRRVARLDRGLGDPRAELAWFISTLARVTDSGGTPDVVTVDDADSVVGACRLLARLNEVMPEVVSGPLAPHRQYWISTGKPRHRPLPDPIPHESAFAAATAATVGAKPFDIGLFTSTGVLGGHGMWREYLDLYRGSTLHPKPWHIWSAEPQENVVVREIGTARQWVELVRSHPKHSGTYVYPDWAKITAEYHAVHVTLRAIAASQGLSFPTADGLIAPPYWDVESTLWLRWCFRSTELVDVVT